MEYITSRNFTLPVTPPEMGRRGWYNMWQKQLWPYRELSVGDILYWLESKSGTVVWKTQVVDVDRFQYTDKATAVDRMEQKFGKFDRGQRYLANAPDGGFCLAYRVATIERVHVPKPDGLRFPHQGWLSVESELGRKWLRGRAAGQNQPALTLRLHQRYGRRDIYAAVGVRFSQQNRNQLTGLSPRCTDGGYFIFITLNKESYPSGQDYDDVLYSDRLVWITRRGRGEEHKDYVRLRQHDTRVSLFVRNNPGEHFVYAGELRYVSHRQIVGTSLRDTQQLYSFKLSIPVPEHLLEELTFGLKKNRRGKQHTSKSTGRRNPADFNEMRKAYQYALGGLDRTVVPEHYNYQVQLKQYLTEKGLQPEFERHFLDVSFEIDRQRFIGEIKVTRFLTISEAFRTALGQLLEYAYTKFDRPPRMIMFLDAPLDSPRVKLARQLGISVVIREHGTFQLKEDSGYPTLRRVFA
jgi:hypothetical protein